MMSDDIEDEGPIEETVETVEAPPEKVIPPETIELARKYGWRPKEQDNLPEGSWMDAERYVAATKTRVRIQADEIAELRRHNAATDAIAKQANDLIRRQERQRFEQELQNIRAAKEEAVEAADKEKYQQLDNYEAQLRTAPQQPEVHPDVIAYKETPEGKEWMDDPILVDFARNAIAKTPGIVSLPPAEQVRWGYQQVKRYLPHMFQPKPEQPREDNGRYTASRVDGGGLAGGNRSSGLDADERAAFAEMNKKQPGLFKNESEYVAYQKKLGIRE